LGISGLKFIKRKIGYYSKVYYIYSMEIFKDIKGYKGFYQISNLGNVKSLSRIINNGGRETNIKERVLKTKLNHGYKRVCLNRDSINKDYSIHRLIAISFIPNNENKPHVNHIDGNKLNNSISNLEWCTHAENMNHAFRIGLINNTGQNQTNSILNEGKVKEIKELLKSGLSQYKIGLMYGVSRGAVLGIHLKNTWKHLL